MTPAASPTAARALPGAAADLSKRYATVRSTTDRLAAPITAEDAAIQAMPDASPTRWHLAHTSWFFETFVLAHAEEPHRPFHPAYAQLFNSYYNSLGKLYPRSKRGLLSRPSLDEVRAYRRNVDERMQALLGRSDRRAADLSPIVELGLQHEQQHQELLLTDILSAYALNPLHPVYDPRTPTPSSAPDAARWLSFPGGLSEIGHAGTGFAYDNESPRHRVFLAPYELSSRPVTNGEVLAFLEDGGYRRHELWLSLGWDRVQAEGWSAPLYWTLKDGRWWHVSLQGLLPLDPHEPAVNLSLFEADAYAAWAGARLPTEAEWECAAAALPVTGNLLGSGALRPRSAAPSRAHPSQPASTPAGPMQQAYGDLWEWTSSAYAPYPGFRPWEGALGEYNGKFMCNQYVLRGGSCFTPADHIRVTYRNFFPPEARWQMTGVRLARAPC